MKARSLEVLWLDTHPDIPLAKLAELSGLSEMELRTLTEFGVFEPVEPAAEELSYRAEYIVTARTGYRLREDLELNTEGLALVLKLLERLKGLETQLNDLRARLPREMDQS